MAYTVAQLRRVNGTKTYMQDIEVTQTSVNTPSIFGTDKVFKDFACARA